jgi:hypothetical protein
LKIHTLLYAGSTGLRWSLMEYYFTCGLLWECQEKFDWKIVRSFPDRLSITYPLGHRAGVIIDQGSERFPKARQVLQHVKCAATNSYSYSSQIRLGGGSFL